MINRSVYPHSPVLVAHSMVDFQQWEFSQQKRGQPYRAKLGEWLYSSVVNVCRTWRKIDVLVGGLEHVFHILAIIIPTD